jgi:hypothetical protein
MKIIKISGMILLLALAFSLSNVAFAYAQLKIEVPSFGPPVVQMPQEQINVAISQVNGILWAQVDAAYNMSTVHRFGDIYVYGDGTRAVLYNQLDAYYPVPLNASDVSLKMDGTELNCNLSSTLFQLYGQNLPEMKWTITPVPKNFLLTAYYEHPVSEENGNYVFLYSFGSRFTLDSIDAETNNWFNGSTATFDIHVMLNYIANINAYTIDDSGKLSPAVWTVTREDSANTIHVTVTDGVPYGLVVLFNQEPEQSPSATPTVSPQRTSSPAPTVSVLQVAAGSANSGNLNGIILAVASVTVASISITAVVLKKRQLRA